jgi:hypothetical protein
MQQVESLRECGAMVNEWAARFKCPLMNNVQVLSAVVQKHITKSRYNDGVIRSATVCNACKEQGVNSWVSRFALNAAVNEAGSQKYEFLCPTCHVAVVPMPPRFTEADHAPLDTVHVPHTLTFPEVHVLQRRLHNDSQKIQDLEKAMRQKDVEIASLRQMEANACAHTFFYCLRSARDSAEDKFLLDLHETQPDTFRRLVRQKVFRVKME